MVLQMKRRQRNFTSLLLFLLFIFIFWAFLTFCMGYLYAGDCDSEEKRSRDGHKMAVIIPLRDRFEELQDVVLNLTSFLKAQHVSHHIFAVNQVDQLRFNRGSLLNVGFLESDASYDYLALHDVDLLPFNNDLLYSYPVSGPLHLAAPHLHPRYHYPTFIGGVMLITRDHFSKVNGLSTNYWGWGLEDDEFYARLKEAGLPISRPGNLSTGYQTFKHIHDRRRRSRDQVRCYDQHLVLRRRDRSTGLRNVKYTLLSRRRMSIDNICFTVLNVELTCDTAATPWCDCVKSSNNSPKTKRSEILGKIPPGEMIAPKLNYKKHVDPDG